MKRLRDQEHAENAEAAKADWAPFLDFKNKAELQHKRAKLQRLLNVINAR